MYGSVRGSVAEGKWPKLVYGSVRVSVHGSAFLQHSKANGSVMEVMVSRFDH